LACGVSTIGSTTAHAQAAAADADALKRAREQFGQALALQTGGDWAGALALLKEVAAVKPTPQVRFNIALCEERLGRLVAALGDYELAASDAQAEKADQVRDEVDARLESLKARARRPSRSMASLWATRYSTRRCPSTRGHTWSKRRPRGTCRSSNRSAWPSNRLRRSR
jgi:tetratricopeptide (TPR) repeat protein